jgi:methylaspartate ammonia-lyase
MTTPAISRIFFSIGLGSYYREEIGYLQSHPTEVLDRYLRPGQKQTRLREPSEVVSIGAQLPGRGVFWGDSVGVAFSGKSGRQEALPAAAALSQFRDSIQTLLVGKLPNSYRSLWQTLDPNARQLPLSIQYGLSQLCVALVAAQHERSMAEVWCQEFQLPRPTQLPSFHGSCGSDRYHGALKMMVQGLKSHPAGQGDHLPEVLGLQGEKLLEYLKWWKGQAAKFGQSYVPCFHFDVHGLIGTIFDNKIDAVAEYLQKLETAAHPHRVRIESPLVMPTLEAQLDAYANLRVQLRRRGSKVALVVDEWANTLADIRKFLSHQAADWIHIKMPDLGPLHDSLQAVLECKQHGVGALLGGSCIETFTSSKASYHLALAVQPDLVLLKPGMGFDEALSLAHNEMHQALVTFNPEISGSLPNS